MWRRLPKRFGNWYSILYSDESMSLDSTIVKVSPDGTSAPMRTVHSLSASRGEDGRSKFIWLPQMLRRLDPITSRVCMIMDKAYEGDETRQLVLDSGFTPVVPPKRNRIAPWQDDRSMYRRRNEVERLFRRLRGFRRIFSCFDKLGIMFMAFIHFYLIVEALR